MKGTLQMALYVPPSIRHFEPKRLDFSTWVDHMAFAYDLVAATRPQLLVELGTYSGLSYFTFCQSIKEHDIDSVAYAIDTWKGEEHTGAYGEEIYESVMQHNRENYPGFSYLMRMLFGEAAGHFADESIDLLHIDGLHTYEAVNEDFETWLPKVKPGGIVIFHDIQSRMADFGVWRFWDDLCATKEYETFSFKQGYGLGVLRKSGRADERESQLEELMFHGSEQDHEDLRAFYAHAARFLILEKRAQSGHLAPKVGLVPEANHVEDAEQDSPPTGRYQRLKPRIARKVGLSR